jgi:hypothetical protein
MCSTTPKTKAASPAIAGPAAIQKSTASTPAPSPNAFGGFQEAVPDAVFLSTSGTPAFLASAKKYYSYFGFKPTDIKSVEHLVNVLADPGNANTYKRLLLVSHAHPRGMLIPFFTGGVTGTNKEVFRAFAESDLEGLRVLNPFDPPIFDWDSVFPSIMTNLRARANVVNALNPFGLGTSGEPQSSLRNFFRRSFDARFINSPASSASPGVVFPPNLPLTNKQRKICFDFMIALISQIGKSIVGTQINSHTVSKTEIEALKAALTTVNIGDLEVGSHHYTLTSFVPDNVNFFPTLENAARAVNDDFHAKIVQMRKRFIATSAIDIRGCRVGEDSDYLLAIREFFSKPQNPGLTVSGPVWFESFPVLAWHNPSKRNDIKGFLAGAVFSSTVHHDEQMKGAKYWAKLLKIDPLHTDFWANLFSGPSANFTALTWVNNIPALFISTPGLKALVGVPLATVVAKVADLFNVPVASVPNASQIASKDDAAFKKFMVAAADSMENGDGLYYYILQAGLPLFLFNKSAFANHEGLIVHKDFDTEAMQNWFKCLWRGSLPANPDNKSANAKLTDEQARHAPMLQDAHAATEWAVCPANEFGDRIQVSS